MGKNLNPSSSNLPNPSAAADKAAGNAKGLASDAKQGAKNVASDLSENPLSGLADKVCDAANSEQSYRIYDNVLNACSDSTHGCNFARCQLQ